MRDLTRRKSLAVLGSLLAGASIRAEAGAADPLRIVVAFPPGGTSTASLAPLRGPLGAALGRSIEMDYRPGAGGNVAALHVARAAPDGNTLLFGHAGPLCINHHINARSYFDPARDLAPIAMVVAFPIVIAVTRRLGIDSLEGLVAHARSREVVVGSSGNGTIQHLAGESFRVATGISTLHVPFAGGAPLQAALLRGDIDVMFETGSNLGAHIKSGRVVPLAVMAPKRLPMLPDVPTLAEKGMKGLDVAAWFGLLAPTATPEGTRAALAERTLSVLDLPEIAESFEAIGAVPRPMGPATFAAHIAGENERWRRVVRDARITPD